MNTISNQMHPHRPTLLETEYLGVQRMLDVFKNSLHIKDHSTFSFSHFFVWQK